MDREKAEQILSKLILENKDKEVCEALYQGIHDMRMMCELTNTFKGDIKYMERVNR